MIIATHTPMIPIPNPLNSKIPKTETVSRERMYAPTTLNTHIENIEMYIGNFTSFAARNADGSVNPMGHITAAKIQWKKTRIKRMLLGAPTWTTRKRI